MKITIKDFKNLFVLFVISICTLFFWQRLEIFYNGYVTPTIVDSIIGIILNLSIFANYLLWNKLKEENKDNGKLNK